MIVMIKMMTGSNDDVKNAENAAPHDDGNGDNNKNEDSEIVMMMVI